MPVRKVRRQTPLRCRDCGREFTGPSTWAIHTLEKRVQPVQSMVERVEASCPRCGSHIVEARDA